jgi:hypothetical protein
MREASILTSSFVVDLLIVAFVLAGHVSFRCGANGPSEAF